VKPVIAICADRERNQGNGCERLTTSMHTNRFLTSWPDTLSAKDNLVAAATGAVLPPLVTDVPLPMLPAWPLSLGPWRLTIFRLPWSAAIRVLVAGIRRRLDEIAREHEVDAGQMFAASPIRSDVLPQPKLESEQELPALSWVDSYR
jgi:hypothetical protein